MGRILFDTYPASAWRALHLAVLESPRYWRLRASRSRLAGHLGWRKTRVRQNLRTSRQALGTFGTLALITVKPLAFALAAILVDQYLPELAIRAQQTQWPDYLGVLALGASAIASLGTRPPFDTYSQLVGTYVGVAGTLLALYFATIGIVASTTYLRSSPQLRALVVRLPAGRAYSSASVFAITVGLLVLAMPSFGREATQLTLAIGTIAALMTVVGLARLGTSLFDFLEPSGLLTIVARDMQRWLDDAVKYQEPGRTAVGVIRCRNGMRYSISLLAAISDLVLERASRDDRRNASGVDPRVAESAKFVTSLWLAYATVKPQLALNSGWYFDRSRHKNWFLASQIETSMAISTQTMVAHEDAPDGLWVERLLADRLTTAMSSLSIPEAAALLTGLPDITRHLAGRGMFEEARLWSEMLTSSEVVSEGSDTDDQSAYRYNIVDATGLAQVNAILGLGDYARSLQKDFGSWTVAEGRGHDRLVLGPAPRALVTELRSVLAFEVAAEGAQITPDYVVRQLVARDTAAEMMDQVTALVTSLEDQFSGPLAQLIAPRDAVAAAALLRMDEALHKFEVQLHDVERLLELCDQSRKDVDDRWPNTDLSKIRERIATLASQTVIQIAGLTPVLDVSHHPDRPDTFAWAYMRSVDATHEAILAKDSRILEATVPHLFAATDRAIRRLNQDVKRVHPSVKLAHVSEPNIALCQLSGIALVFSRLWNEPAIFEPFERGWDAALRRGKVEVANAMIASLHMQDGLFAITGGKLRSTERLQRSEHRLRELGYDVGHFGRFDGKGLSPWLRRVLRNIDFYDFDVVFLATHVLPMVRGESALIELPRQLEELAKSLDRDEQEDEEEDDDGPPW